MPSAVRLASPDSAFRIRTSASQYPPSHFSLLTSLFASVPPRLPGQLLPPQFPLQTAPGATKNPVFRRPHPLKVIGRQVIGVEERIPQARMRVADATGGRNAGKKKATGTRRARQAPNARVRPTERRCHGRIRPMTQLNKRHGCPEAAAGRRFEPALARCFSWLRRVILARCSALAEARGSMGSRTFRPAQWVSLSF